MPEGDLGRDPPPGLTPSQADSWRYAVDHMPAGVLKMVDRGLLLVWVEAEDRHRTAMKMQAKLDASSELKLLIKTPSGLVSSPYIRILDRTAKTMLRAVQELGFSPASRTRVKAPPKPAVADPTNPWVALRLVPSGRPDPDPAA
jgi:P27 family predicted phage terminase small subunit